MSRQRKWGSLLVDVAEEGCPPLHLWFHMHGISLLWPGTIEKKIVSLLDIRRFLRLFILSSCSLKNCSLATGAKRLRCIRDAVQR